MHLANTKSRKRLTLKENYGFTLIELLLVLAVLVTIFAFAFPTMNSFADRNRSQRCIRDIRVSLLAARQQAIDDGTIVRWDLPQTFERSSVPMRETTANAGISRYSARGGDAKVAKLIANGPLLFRPNGTAVDARITIWDTGIEIGSLYVVGATGAITSEDSRP